MHGFDFSHRHTCMSGTFASADILMPLILMGIPNFVHICLVHLYLQSFHSLDLMGIPNFASFFLSICILVMHWI